jgi:hypothetical protein
MKLFTHIFRYLQVPPPTIHRLGAKGYNTECLYLLDLKIWALKSCSFDVIYFKYYYTFII